MSSCYNGEVRLANPDSDTSGFSEDTSGFLEDTSGFLEVCYEGVWVSVCLKIANTNTSQLAELACRNIIGSGGMSFTGLIVIYTHMYMCISVFPYGGIQ